MPLNPDTLIHEIEAALKRWSPSSKNVSSSASSKPTGNPSKSTAKAHTFREIGNSFYRKKKFGNALFLYTGSIAYASEDSVELCKAYGNRSAVLFELKKYAPCLLDINRALKSQCPTNLSMRQKLHNRKERCLARMKSAPTNNQIEEDATNPLREREPTWRADLMLGSGNPLLPNASPKIKLKYDEKWGRHFVATADINPGETLLSENYFVTVFSNNAPFKYCDFCVTMCDALIPCLSCTRTMYCSEQCRLRAYDSYHRLECKRSFLTSYYSVGEVIATRLFLTGTSQGAALENLMNTLSISDIFADNFDFTDQPTRSDYLTALRLVERSLDPTHLKLLIEDAVKVVIMLQDEFAFFESVPDDRLKNAEVFATALLLNNYQDRFINKFSANDDDKLPIREKDGLCLGLMVLQCMFNHSCYPNVATHRRKRENIVFAVRPIKKGEQIFIAYYDDFVSTPKAERIEALNFTCLCEACSNNWPTYTESGTPSMRSPIGEILMKMVEDYTPYDAASGRPDPILAQLMKVIAPLVDDRTLLNLRVGELLRIVADMISLLYKVMRPTSFILTELRLDLQFFAESYYDERERDPTYNRSFKFPKNTSLDHERLTVCSNTMNTEVTDLEVLSVLSDVIRRLNTYKLKSSMVRLC